MAKMPYEMNTMIVMNYFFAIFALIALSHQVYWGVYLDSCWCSSNYIELDRLAELKIKKNQGEKAEDE